MSNKRYQEPIDELTEAPWDLHRATMSLMKEIEAVDWYSQRVDACKSDELRAILVHNRDEEKEHAAMLLEWIRRQDASSDNKKLDVTIPSTEPDRHAFDCQMERYLGE